MTVTLAAAAALAGAVILTASLVGADPYRVRPGDTLSGIAVRLGVPVEDLIEANDIDDPDFIVAGEVLVVPSDGGWGTDYVVREGDTLTGIAHRVGVPIADLMQANGIGNADHVRAGRILAVPGRARPGAGSYTVRPGENLTTIAARLGVSPAALAGANSLDNPNLVFAGQVLTVPGRWMCPVPGASFVNDYGYVKPNGSRHEGVDMFAPRGTPIQAPEPGTITRFPNRKGGNAVHLRTADGTRYYFAHLDAYGATGSVAAGETIGTVGTSGDAAFTAPHLHIEFRPRGGDSVNPFPTLVAACS